MKGVETEISQKTQKVGNLSTKTAKPKFSKIRQKSNFAPILLGCISKFSEEQGLLEKQGQISLATIFKHARFKSPGFKDGQNQNFQKSAKNPILLRSCWAAYQNF